MKEAPEKTASDRFREAQRLISIQRWAEEESREAAKQRVWAERQARKEAEALK